MKVKEVFKNQEELNQCLRWWQEKLFLTDWIIKARICHPDEFTLQDCMGENIVNNVNKCSIIHILDPKYYGDYRIVKYCAEEILVHELLHCRYNWLDSDGTYESRYMDTIEHSFLEQMARSLIMVKYGLDFAYFHGEV